MLNPVRYSPARAKAIWLLSTLLLPSCSALLEPVLLKGTKFFFQSNGTQFFIKGVAYQADVANQTTSTHKTYHDPLADVEACERDVPLLQELGTNTIRVYAIDPLKDHSKCMEILDKAGIYVISDLSEPGLSINRDQPVWDERLYARYTAVVDSLAGYPNVLGFFAGNEVSNQANNTNASPYVKAAIRDMKTYIKSRGYRTIPVGYATNDDADIRYQLADYFNCGDVADRAEFWGYNIYSWCGESTFSKSGYEERTEDFKAYGLPVFFAEYGCNDVQPRKFTEVQALYGPQMNDVFSGGIVYMYHEESNNYGLVKVNESGAVTKLEDFNNLKKQIQKVKPAGVKLQDYKPGEAKGRECPEKGENWDASNKLPPTPDKSLCRCMMDSLECAAKSSVQDDEMGDLFDFVCGQGIDCTAIYSNGSTGVYGPLSMCNSTERLSWVFNSFYLSKHRHKEACDFRSSGKKKTRVEPTGTCKTVLEGVQVNYSTLPPPPLEAAATALNSLIVDSRLLMMSSLFIAATVAGAVVMIM